MDSWAIYIFARGVSGILVETGRFFSARTMAFYGFNSSFRAIFFLTLPPLSKNWSKKRNRGRWGGGPGGAICGRNRRFLEDPETAVVGVGGRAGFWSLVNSASV